MKGKKSNPQFVSQFISKCVNQGIIIPEDMVAVAKNEINSIDVKIKEVQSLKIVRSNLLDVVALFDKNEVKIEEGKVLSFFKLKYPNICKELCNQLKNGSISISALNSNPDYIFCIKQMLELNIISRDNQSIMRGNRFAEYITFILREV